MGGKTTVEAPKATPEEVALQKEQTQLLQLQRDSIQSQQEFNKILTPILLDQAGYEPVFDSASSKRADELRTRRADLQAQLSITPQLIEEKKPSIPMSTWGTSNFGTGTFGYQPGTKSTTNSEYTRIQNEISQIDSELQNIDPNRIVGLKKKEDPVLTEQDKLRQEIETDLLKRTNAALKGELPVDPGLIRDLDKFDKELENKLRAQFGDLTSTPAQEALQRAKESKTILLEQARRGDLTLAEQLSQQRQFANESLTDSSINRPLTIAGTGNVFANQFAQGVQSAGVAQQPFQFNRQLQFNAAIQNANQPDPFGQIFGTVLGAAAGGFGGGFGAKAGAALFT